MQLSIVRAIVALLPAVALSSPINSTRDPDNFQTGSWGVGHDSCPPFWTVAGDHCFHGNKPADPRSCSWYHQGDIVRLLLLFDFSRSFEQCKNKLTCNSIACLHWWQMDS